MNAKTIPALVILGCLIFLGVYKMSLTSSIPVQLHPGIPHDQLVAMINQNFEATAQRNSIEIADSGTATLAQFSADFFGTGSGSITKQHNLNYVPLVLAFFEDPNSPGSYKQWVSEVGGAVVGTYVDFKSYHQRLISATANSVTFTEDYYWATPAPSTAGPYTIKYFLLRETAQ